MPKLADNTVTVEYSPSGMSKVKKRDREREQEISIIILFTYSSSFFSAKNAGGSFQKVKYALDTGSNQRSLTEQWPTGTTQIASSSNSRQGRPRAQFLPVQTSRACTT